MSPDDGAPGFYEHTSMPPPDLYEHIAMPRRPKPFMKPRNFLLVAGTFILLLVIIIPILDAFRLMNHATFVFFLGRAWPMKIIWTCLGGIFLYQFLLVLLFACAREEAKTDTSMFILFAVVLTTIGISLLSISVPLKSDVMAVHEEIFSNCQFGGLTQRLYEYSTVLQGLRAQQACASHTTIVRCDGYQESMPYTGFLHALEREYKCAGFCYGNSTATAAAAAVSAGLAHAHTRSLQAQSFFGQGTVASETRLSGALQSFVAQLNQPASLLETSEGSVTKEFADIPHGSPVSNYGSFVASFGEAPGPKVTTKVAPNSTATQPGRTVSYPPTLFSKENYQASCDAMAARDLKFQGITTAQMIQFEGIFLLLIVMAASVVAVCGLCVQVPKGHVAQRIVQSLSAA